MQKQCYKYNANVKNTSVKNAEKKQKKAMHSNYVIIYYKCKLSLFGRDDTKQGKSLIFIVIHQAEQKKS